MLVAETVQSETVLVGLGSVVRREREGEKVRSVQSGGSGEEDDGRVCSAGARREKNGQKKKPRGFDGRPTATGSNKSIHGHGCRLQRQDRSKFSHLNFHT
jgi:hypothetical protein